MYYTRINIEPHPQRIAYSDQSFFIGSCFSANISDKFRFYKLNTEANPFGVLYNPASIFQTLELISSGREIGKEDFFQEEDIYKSFLFHSQWAGMDVNELIQRVNDKVAQTCQFLKQIKWVFITFGTSYVYELKSNGEIVANCHKQNAGLFTHRMLSVEEVSQYIEKISKLIYAFSPKANLVFTVSPVRHLKQGASFNQLSKATLIVALSQYLAKDSQAYYFPSYEIFNDELRDYRFYAEDMVHPSGLGIEHVWKRFSEIFFDDQTQKLMTHVGEIKSACEHKVFFPESKAYEAFRIKLLQKIEQLSKDLPFLSFEEETKMIVCR